MDLDEQNGVDLATRQTNLKQCYIKKAKIVLNQEFCDSQYNTSIALDFDTRHVNVENMYDECYVLFDEPIIRDIRFCELLYPRDTKTKFHCTYCVKAN